MRCDGILLGFNLARCTGNAAGRLLVTAKCPIFQFLWMESPVGYPVQSSCGSEAFEVLNVHDDASISVSARQRAPTCGLTYESVMVVSWAFMMFYGDIM
jgi:hypothetical protein